ncbi:MAG: flagellar motor protein MotB [Pseudomonadota bacterium]
MRSGFSRAAFDAQWEQNANTERWIVSYADFITLLFAFFVVMYSISSVNDGKFRVLAEMLPEVFNDEGGTGEEVLSAVPIDLGGRTIESLRNLAALEAVINEQESDVLADAEPLDIEPNASVEERVSQALEPIVEIDGVNVRDGQQWLEVELPNELLFGSGQTQLSKQALPILQRMAESIKDVESPIRVEGYTDNIPIRGGAISSNWQLSAVRAAAVVEQFTQSGIQPLLMSAVGYGEFYPVDDNTTEQGRAKNRRVVVAIAKHGDLVGGKPVSHAKANTQSSLELARLARISRLPGPIGIF